ncbi:MAG: hypothetical protein A3H57_01490 [Candidatus Taylorbacteria bacterium RIFCSPLOWO2_02_FULL_43_11]|uniref:Uncharacterized protein n=1 Tax=Candidatus Taylorbacteria bacterium RIFCSPHIGHO2_02_FULL_43_32b TaxID=1802306 RepID=A0A1G2MK94_9BACT|nr:MAG: hypothetical protein A2743_00960 [Candidatus Taylorbacteria bacterium RIFCSPHIGHO2_01_FULL_43_47]OHA24268.1 MAG: hypothetical protein A3C72_04375 [Candidatus Taylorbacteria bacterium RIFCSPHIGHO2_02_FULL_43_32b]OHA31385.1 MAG: hypothetical protein A3B08_00595 [Candidatus Taylorbacteria bacterium RIFCSPLOWO2_01_FULL_43_44]OHA36581.1 MAG: hypothetical protein A3H57_01490 [Candidatus Taylorbacteria bacterium RIFCSPLOWO2_02_FULL_43_11]
MFKNWPYWLKGGVISGGAALLFMLASYVCAAFGGAGIEGGRCAAFLILPTLPAILLDGIFSFSTLPAIATFSILLTFWFLLGALAGWIFRKFIK